MSTTGGSRKRRRISPDAASLEGETRTMEFAHAPGHDYAAAALQSERMDKDANGNGQGSENETQEAKTACHHELSLRTLHSDLDSMRQLITCNICQRFMYEPYALSCGHTYCYSCLAEWMGKNHKKTCPDCRTHVKQEPTPAFLIKEMVLIFVNRTQLLPDEETSEEHKTMAREEAEILSKDRTDTDERQGGLFKGTFSRASARPIIALHDTSDHVDRCPNCLHEVEDGWCLTCHVRVRASDSDENDDGTDSGGDPDITEELDMDLEAPDMTGEHMRPWGVDGHHIYGGYSEEDEDDENEDDHDLTGFVEDEVRWESDAGEPDYSFEAVDFEDTPQIHRITSGVASDVSDSEDDDSDEMQPVRRRRLVNRRAAPSSARAPITVDSGSDEDDSEDEGPRVPSNSQRARGRIVQSDDEASSNGAPSASDSEDTTHRDATVGFSPPQYDSDDTSLPAAGGLSPFHFDRYPIHPPSTTASDSDDDSDSNNGESRGSVDEESRESHSDDEEDGDSDIIDTEMRDPESGDQEPDEDSDGSEQNTLIEPNPLHRLETLVQRRPRFVDPLLRSRVEPPLETSPARLPRVSRRSMPHPQRNLPRPQRTTQTRAPPHPFNLDSTLARIAAANRETQARYPADPHSSRALSQRHAASDRIREPTRTGQRTFLEDQNRRTERTANSSRTSGRGRLGVSDLVSNSDDSNSSRTARDEDHDSGHHLMGAMGDMSDDSTGW